MIEFLVSGIILGSVAGISPGPLLALVISETIKVNYKQGIKVAFSVFLSDLPIVGATIFIVSKFSEYNLILGIISFLGSVFIAFLAYENISIKSFNLQKVEVQKNALVKGALTNLFSPHPYLFWILVGAPTFIKASQHSWVAAFLFILGFYVFIVGTKVIIAVLSEKSKNFISSKSYLLIIKILGYILLLFSLILIYDGLQFFGII